MKREGEEKREGGREEEEREEKGRGKQICQRSQVKQRYHKQQ